MIYKRKNNQALLYLKNKNIRDYNHIKFKVNILQEQKLLYM